MVTLYQLMRRKPSRIRHDARVKEAAWQMQERHTDALLVQDSGGLVGLVTEADVAGKAKAQGRELAQTYVHQIMSRLVLYIEANRSPHEVFEMMSQLDVSHFVVTDVGRIVGVVSDRDILNHFTAVSQLNSAVA